MGFLVGQIVLRKEAQKAKITARKEWKSTFDAIPDLITILDTDYRIIFTNKALSEMRGILINDILGKRCYQIFCGKEKAPGCCPYRNLQHDKHHVTMNYIMKNQDFFLMLFYHFYMINQEVIFSK